VGIFIGNGQFIHASSGRSKQVKIDSINTGYYNARYVGAKRVL
jgi:cell wall-associated NlpC family hydrolase